MDDYTHHIMPRKPRPTQRSYGGPAALVAVGAIIMLLLLGVTAAFAQSSNSQSASEASANVEVASGAAAGAAINNYGQKPGSDNKTYQEVATAPSLGGLALGGGHPCAYSPATAQISIVGGGAGIGGSKVDSACMLMVMGAAGDTKAYRAAQLMLAARDPAACRAMEAAGMVDCGDKAEPKTTKAAKNVDGGKCVLTGRKLVFRVSSGGDRDAELSACKARYGL